MRAVVFIHGFLGSEESFHCFPLELQELLPDTECLHYPTFDTKGNNLKCVMQLVDWLLLNTTTIKYESVILCAHSMGGLLAVDAYRYLYQLELKEIEARVADQVGISIAQRIENTLSYSRNSTNQESHSARHLVNIVGIFSFDSPFYGLHRSVITKSSIRNFNDAINAIEIPEISKIIPEYLPTGLKDLKIPISSPKVQEVETPSEKSNMSTIAKYAATGTAIIAAASLFPISVIPVAGAMFARQWIISQAEITRQKLQFLYPLASSASEMNQRVMTIYNAFKENAVCFKGYYLTYSENQSSSRDRVFCEYPHKEVEDVFYAIKSNSDDEIHGHVYLFSKDLNGDFYQELMKSVKESIIEIYNKT